MCFIRKKKKEVKVLTEDLIKMIALTTDDDEYLANLANELIAGAPLILNFDKLGIDVANKVISFMAGVCFAINGHTMVINRTTYLFTNETAFDDGSLDKFIQEIM